ncbi:MAG: glutamate synthase-related protein [Anaerolineales bacterium]
MKRKKDLILSDDRQLARLQTSYADSPWLDEHDACAIVASVRKHGEATHGNLKRALDALSKMGHRSGDINGEGDGCGVQTDIPRRLWADALASEGKPAWLADDQRFFVGHFLIPKSHQDQAEDLKRIVLELVQEAGADLLLARPAQTRPLALGKMGRAQAPLIWQVAGLMRAVPLDEIETRLFAITLKIENQTPIHVASLSRYSVIYKVRGSIETLYQYYPELRSPRYMTAITLGHARYSTNTATAFERVQPFSLLGHNGEINTIARLREQARMLGVQLVAAGSDSQDLDRTLAALIHQYGFSLIEAMELVFPPIQSEVQKLDPELHAMYRHYRQGFGPYAQGPAAIIARFADDCVFSVDALGLRPLWFGETEKEYFLSSEKGVYHLDTLLSDPRPLSPGEKMGLRLHRNEGVEVCEYAGIQAYLLNRYRDRTGGSGSGSQPGDTAAAHQVNTASGVTANTHLHDAINREPGPQVPDTLTLERWLAASGWGRDDRDWVQSLAETGHEPISSIGYDGPLAALSGERQNLADYFKEAVAVVTNPSIDREREMEHFSTQSLVGPRPDLLAHTSYPARPVVLECPVLVDGRTPPARLPREACQQAVRQGGGMCLEDLIARIGPQRTAWIDLVLGADETVPGALTRLAETAVAAVQAGAAMIVLDDRAVLSGAGWLDPHLALAVIDWALRAHFWEVGEPDAPLPLSLDAGGRIDLEQLLAPVPRNARRQAGLVLRSAGIRNLHDLAMALGLGADAVVPYLLFETAVDDVGGQRELDERRARLTNTLTALRAGLEKVISTMGIHELRGYGRLFASIGLSQPIAEVMGALNYGGSLHAGLSWEHLQADAAARAAILAGEARPQLTRVNHFYPKVWKAAGQIGRGEATGQEFERKNEMLAKTNPVALRHVIDFRFPVNPADEIQPDDVDAGLTGHALPFVIASMSFGSQGETAFRAYAQAAYWLNIIALNGEGGEIPDMLGKYPHNRGQQIASGRFGVGSELINSSNLLEIKIGQGAKPGEGGHLPGRKVSEKVAQARHAQPGIDLISPSNNHDIYSIEDLAQFIEELKTANPKARVAVKVPVVPGIGIIAVGIAKAGADIINMSGYDGGTGAARAHALRNVGLPAEIGVVEAHRALTESGLRHKVELWCDGGMRTAADVVKMICLGANRVGFGTLAMVAIGCTICRACQHGTCHVGITTQIESADQAEQLGLKHFVPRDAEQAVDGLLRVFSALGEGVKEITARLGFKRTQNLVGRADLLEQVGYCEQLDLSEMLMPAAAYLQLEADRQVRILASGFGGVPLHRPRNHLTTVISNMVMEMAALGEAQVSFEDDKVSPVDRALGTHLTGALIRFQRHWTWPPGHGGVGGDQETWRRPINGTNGNGHHMQEASLRFFASSVPGNGLGAYNGAPLNILVEGGAQDGVAKGMQGGQVVILKGYNHDGVLIDGSVGKSLAYGAIGGLVIVQGNADSRACIRLSGADVIIGGEIKAPLDDSAGFVGARANVKGFLCEYMTAGRVLVLGDPGPWICSGMTGGVLYLRLQPEMNFDLEAIQRRIAQGAKVNLGPVGPEDQANLETLLGVYAEELAHNHQEEAARQVSALLDGWQARFVKIEPLARQTIQAYATE